MNSIRCRQCKHYIEANAGEGKIYGCDRSKCVFEPTTKNDLSVDCVDRQDVKRYIEGFINEYTPGEELELINLELDGLNHIPSVVPRAPKEYGLGDSEEYKCNICIHDLLEIAHIIDYIDFKKRNYCPCCGSRKEAESEE